MKKIALGFMFLSAFLMGASVVGYYKTLDSCYIVTFIMNTVLLYFWKRERRNG